MSRRRDVLRALFGAPFAAHLVSCGESRQSAAPVEIDGELVGPDLARGHQLRDAVDLSEWDGIEIDEVDVAILGGGAAGLSAGWRLMKAGHDQVRVFEMEPSLGGTAASGESRVTRYPWGAHYLPLPPESNTPLRALLEEMGAIHDGEPAEELLIREPDERVFYRGFWYPGLYPYANASEDDLRQLARFEREMDEFARRRDGAGRRAFAIPVSTSSDDAELLALDRTNAASWLAERGFTSARLLWLCDYACRDDYGLRLADTSAWALLFYWVSRLPDVGGEAAPLMTWPEGNGALISHMAGVLEGRTATGEMVAAVESHNAHVRILLIDRSGARSVVHAQRAIVALPRFIATRVVRGMATVERDEYAPWMVANLHLRSRPAELGSPPSWDNVLYDSPSLGYVSATHQRGREVGETVWTYYLPLTADTPQEARRTLRDTVHSEWTDAIVRDLKRAHPDIEEHIGRIDVWRWGHGMVQPRPGFLRGGARLRAGAPFGRLHFAHSDLSGVALFEEAFHHGVRAADEVLAAQRDVLDPANGSALDPPPT